MHFCTVCEIIFLVGGPWKVLKKWLQFFVWTLVRKQRKIIENQPRLKNFNLNLILTCNIYLWQYHMLTWIMQVMCNLLNVYCFISYITCIAMIILCQIWTFRILKNLEIICLKNLIYCKHSDFGFTRALVSYLFISKESTSPVLVCVS